MTQSQSIRYNMQELLNTLRYIPGSKDYIKDALRVAIAEIDLTESRKPVGQSISREEEIAIVDKLIKSNRETASFASDPVKERLTEENQTLSSFLPEEITEDGIKNVIQSNSDLILANTRQGMKHVLPALKATGLRFDGKVVKAILDQWISENNQTL